MKPRLPKNFKQWERIIADAAEGKPTTITPKMLRGLRQAIIARLRQ